MLKKNLIAGALFLFFAVEPSATEVYQWQDQQGQQHFSDRQHDDAKRVFVDPGISFYSVERVFDGDTILLSNQHKVRFLGINTPEVAGRNKFADQGGEQAKNWLKQRLDHKKVFLEADVEAVDKYQRQLAYVFDEHKHLVNLELVERGLAAVSIYPPNLKYLQPLLAAQQTAENAGLGIWSLPQYAVKPFNQLNEENYHGWQRISGRIMAIKSTAKNDYLQFSDQVAVQVPRQFLKLFPDLNSYIGKTIEARGWVRKQNHRFSLLIRHPGELKMLP